MYYPVHKKEPYFSAYPIIKASGYIDEPDLFETEEIKALIMRNCSLSTDQVDDVMAATVPFKSFEDLYGLEADDEESVVPKELIFDAEVEQQIVDKLLKEQITEILNSLTEREKNVIELRYGLDDGNVKTLEEVGALFNVTRERIRQIEAKAVRKLRSSYQSSQLLDYIGFIPKPERQE